MTPTARRTARRRAGFTLIEVVLAMGLLLLGATAILGLFAFGAALSRTAGLRTLSAQAAEAVVADLEEGLFPLEEDGSAGEPEAIRERPVPGFPELVYSAEAIRGGGEGIGETWRVDVEMGWKGGAPRRGKKFSVLLLREVPFGTRMRRSLVRERREAEEPAPDEIQPEVSQ